MKADWNDNALGLNAQVDLSGRRAQFDAYFNKVKINLSAAMKDGRLRASLQLAKTTFSEILASIPKEYEPGLADTDLKGAITLGLDLDHDAVSTSGFVVDVNGQILKLDLTVTNLYGKPIKVDFTASSDSLDVDKMIPTKTGKQKQAVSDPSQQASAEVGPFDLPLLLVGDVRIGKASYQGVPVTDLRLNVILKNNILSLEKLNAAVAGGSFSKSGRVNLGVRGLKYSGQIELNEVQGSALVKMLKPELAGSIEGSLGGSLQYSGAGTLAETFQEKLAGQGTVRLADGKLQNIPALNSVARLLEVNELREVVLDDGTIDLSIKDGQVTIDSMINGPTTRLLTTGQISLNGTLDLQSQLALSPELGGRLHAQGKLARFLGDTGGWTTVPLRIRGPYASPDVGLDSKGLKKQAEKAVKQEVQHKLEKELQKKLKGLFGN